MRENSCRKGLSARKRLKYLGERINEIFKKYGTAAAIVLSTSITIGAVYEILKDVLGGAADTINKGVKKSARRLVMV